MTGDSKIIKIVGRFILPVIVATAFVSALTAIAADLTSQVIVGNAAPTVTNVVLNGGTNITLTANATTSYNISYTVSDNNGCADLGGVRFSTSTAFRNGSSSICATPSPTTSTISCYVNVTHVTSTCSGTSINVTDTVQIYYFANATDSSSSFPNDHWEAFAFVADLNGGTSTVATSSAVEVLTLTAINVTTSSVNYGTITASSTTGATNQTATSTNAGNSSTTLQLKTSATLTSGVNSIATSSQRYSTTTFTFIGTSIALTASDVTVGGFLLLTPTSTTNVSKVMFWGLEVLAGTPTGTYTGTNVFSSLFQP
ncbi:MAG: hypothetical protein AAB602_03380 [Patescibacteria group bacterium]